MSKSYREHSKANWAPSTGDDTYPGREVMGLGCLQRIADATELMAKDRIQMEADLKHYKEAYERASARADKNYRSMIAYKAAITRLKNKYTRMHLNNHI